MDNNLFWIIGAVTLDGVAGLSGGLLPAAFVQKRIVTFLAFAAGTLVGAAFLDLLPETLSDGVLPPATVMLTALFGFLSFHVIEALLGSHAAGQSGHKHSTIGPRILLGDALHNVTDGIAIAAAFMSSVSTGIVTTLAVIVHELPQEVGDYTILVSHGYSRARAVFLLCLVQLSALGGALGTYWFASQTTIAAKYCMALSAGGFIYIAAADLLPELQRQKPEGSPAGRLLAFFAGIGAIAAVQYLH